VLMGSPKIHQFSRRVGRLFSSLSGLTCFKRCLCRGRSIQPDSCHMGARRRRNARRPPPV
jgi:hypothetical protein